jgi:hypothetical protein
VTRPCKVCGEATEDDGYGEPVHRDTGLYGSYLSPPGYPANSPKHGRLSHVAA